MTTKDRFKSIFRSKPSGDDPIYGHPRYQKIRTLGQGSYGVVMLAVDKQTREKVAIKFWPRGAECINVDVQRELHHHSGFNHPNVIMFREVFITADHVGLAMELAPNGDLFKKVRDAKGLAEAEARTIFQQLILAVDYCHRMGVANRDIKLENVLLGGDKKNPVIKLTDFGFSKSDLDSIPTTICGTPGYMAPEVLMGREYDGRMADVWSCGIMLFVMLYGFYPYDDTREIVLKDIPIPDRPATSQEVKRLIRSMVERDPKKRIKMEEICQQPWVAQGVSADFLTRNEQYVSASSEHRPKQSKAVIDAILYEAGLERPEERQAREQKLQQKAVAANRSSEQGSGSSAYKDPGETMEW
ncbi:g8763 [Coccomyxa viridis]|uniref:G8763 protein n=1 Tax=Coccomyxa viridis TaxID=1274662 RepID=A0ABP1G164_9CHLO